MKKRLLSFVLTLAMIVSLFAGMATTASAAGTDPVSIVYADSTEDSWNGQGDMTISDPATITIKANYEQTGTLTIDGNVVVTIVGQGKTITVTNPSTAFVLKNGADVTMTNVTLERTGATKHLINVGSGTELTCEKIAITEDSVGVFWVEATATLNMSGASNVLSSSVESAIFINYGVMNISAGTYERTGSSGQIVANKDSNASITISGGEFKNMSGTSDTIVNGQINMTGGTITSPHAAAIRSGKSTDVINITGGTIMGSKIAVKVGKDGTTGGKVTIGKDVIFNNNTVDVYLETKNDRIILGSDFATDITVQSGIDLSGGAKHQITPNTNATLDMTEYVSAYVPAGDTATLAVSYNETNGCLYLWDHTHTFTKADGTPNVVPGDADSHREVCTDCDAIQNSTGHIFDTYIKDPTDHWTKCGTCGWEATKVPHDKEIVYILTDTHQFECSVCHTKTAVEAHNWVNVVSDEYLSTAADCENDAVYFKSCSECKVASTVTFEDDDTAIGHDWNDASYAWTLEANGWYCTATRTCKNDSTHVETEKKLAGSTVTTPAECTVMGTTTYTATFTATWADEQTKDVQDIPQLNHDWDTTTYAWTLESGDWHCTATHICKNDSTHVETEKKLAGSTVQTPAKCEEPGTTTYTATFAATWADEQTKDEIDIPQLNHDWNTTSYAWTLEADGWYCTATRICKNDSTHVETEKKLAGSTVTTPAECTVVGTTTYTATFTAAWAVEQTQDVQDIPQLNHDWDTTTYAWTLEADCWYCTATHICKTNNSHVETEKVLAGSTVETPADCVNPGTTTYTATFTATWATEQTKDEIDIPALDHDWTTPWSSDTDNHWHECGRADCTEVKDTAGHTASDWIIDVDAKIGIDGEMHKECVDCKRVLETDTIPALPYPVIVVKPQTDNVSDCLKDATCPMPPFADLDVKAWYHDGVHYCLENDLMIGIGDDQFAPNGMTTRAQLVTMLWRMEGEPLVEVAEGFNDVSDSAWYNNAVRWASSTGIAEGYGDSIFAPNDIVTREQMVTILWRYAKYKGVDVSVGEDTNLLSYEDASDVSTWAMGAMQWAFGSGLIQGIEKDDSMYLDPQGSAVRSQSATMIYRFCTEIMK